MQSRHKSGGTLAFVAACAFIIVLVGVGFFLFARVLGGGREAQAATDSGNLNVAKAALVSPSVPISDARMAIEFGGLTAASGNVDLEHYNNLVGKAFLVALNAQDEGTAQATADAQLLANYLQGPGGLGQQLNNALSNANNSTAVFQSMSDSNSDRMLTRIAASKVSNDTANFKVAYMLQSVQAPSNVWLSPSELPYTDGNSNQWTSMLGNANVIQNRSVTLTSGATQARNYVVGYTPIPLAGGSVTLQTVPVRPGEQPHLVSQQNFFAAQKSPMALGISSAIPPNAFQSSSLTQEQATGSNVAMRSSAIVGLVDTTSGAFPASIPRGFIYIDNTGVVGSESISGPVQDLATLLMSGIYVANVLPYPPYFNTSYVDTSGGNFAPGDNIVPPPPNPLVQVWLSQTSFVCDDTNSSMPPCSTSMPAINAAMSPTNVQGPGSTANNLIAVEAYKAAIINARTAISGSFGCISISASPTCTGLKAYPASGVGTAIPFSSNGTLNQLLSQVSGANVQNLVVQRMYEMNPLATVAQVQAVFNTPIVLGAKYFLYYDGSANSYVVSTGIPANYITPTFTTNYSHSIPDGNALSPATRVIPSLTGKLVNIVGDGGYPHPFDCPYPNDDSTDSITFTPSSGTDNLLGVLKLQNCVNNSGGTWCCPC